MKHTICILISLFIFSAWPTFAYHEWEDISEDQKNLTEIPYWQLPFHTDDFYYPTDKDYDFIGIIRDMISKIECTDLLISHEIIEQKWSPENLATRRDFMISYIFQTIEYKCIDWGSPAAFRFLPLTG